MLIHRLIPRMLACIFAFVICAVYSNALAATRPIINDVASDSLITVDIELDNATVVTVDVTGVGTFIAEIGSASVVTVLVDGHPINVGFTELVTLSSSIVAEVTVTTTEITIIEPD